MTSERSNRPDPVLEVEGLRVEANGPNGRRTLVRSVGLTLRPGESVAIVGESGSGKSLTARAIMGLLPDGLAAEGSVRLDGRELLGLREQQLRKIRGGEIALVMQDPFTILNPLMTCGRQLTDELRREGRRLSKAERRVEAVRRLAEVGIHDESVADRFPFQLSGGMRQRVAIASALVRDPRVLLADEPTTALDVTTQREILELLDALRVSRGMAVVLITHDLRVAFSICDRVSVLYAGSQLEVGPAAELARDPQHPYTLGLFLSEPPLDVRLERLSTVPGSVPEPDAVAQSCAFADRCDWATDVCRQAQPALVSAGADRYTACTRLDEILPELRRRRIEQLHPGAVAAVEIGEGIIVGDALTRTFGTQRGDVHALADVDFHLKAGEAVGIVGESGSGKTTLGRLLVGLDVPTSGRLTIDGVDVTDRSGLDAAAKLALRHRVQMVFQDPYSSLNPRLTIEKTLDEALGIARVEDTTAGELLELVGLPAAYAQRRPVALSGGERQRVAIARALAVKPAVLVCDEAVSALDLSVQAQVLNLLNELRERLGLSLVFITHDLAVVRQIVDRLYVMYHGSVVEQGTTDDVLGSPSQPYTRQLIDSIPGGGHPDATLDRPESAVADPIASPTRTNRLES